MNPSSLKLAFKTPALRKRILIVVAMLAIFRFLSHVPIPIADSSALKSLLGQLLQANSFVGFADLFSGGAISNFSIIIMGLGPYINASIVMQLLTQIVPKFHALKKEGEEGQRKINQYTRMLSLPLAVGQAVAMIFFIRQLVQQQLGRPDILNNITAAEWFTMITIMVAGSMLLMWIGELITEKGVGNGISLLIFAGIVAQLPTMAGQAIGLARSDSKELTTLIFFGVAALLAIYFVVKINEARRDIVISYAKRVRGNRAYGGVESKFPIRVLTAGVIPIIFAVAFLSAPTFLGQIFSTASNETVRQIAEKAVLIFAPTHTVYAIAYFVLVVAFTYFYTSIVYNTTDIAENLQKQGGFIPGVRPGLKTADFLRRVINRLTLTGALSLGIIAILPFVGQRLTSSQFLSFGGTGLLIVVSVAIETLRQLEAQTVMSAYE